MLRAACTRAQEPQGEQPQLEAGVWNPCQRANAVRGWERRALPEHLSRELRFPRAYGSFLPTAPLQAYAYIRSAMCPIDHCLVVRRRVRAQDLLLGRCRNLLSI